MKMQMDYITVQEAAERAEISEGYIRRMFICDGFEALKKEKDYIKLGRVWLINEEAWERFIDKRNM